MITVKIAQANGATFAKAMRETGIQAKAAAAFSDALAGQMRELKAKAMADSAALSLSYHLGKIRERRFL